MALAAQAEGFCGRDPVAPGAGCRSSDRGRRGAAGRADGGPATLRERHRRARAFSRARPAALRRSVDAGREGRGASDPPPQGRLRRRDPVARGGHRHHDGLPCHPRHRLQKPAAAVPEPRRSHDCFHNHPARLQAGNPRRSLCRLDRAAGRRHRLGGRTRIPPRGGAPGRSDRDGVDPRGDAESVLVAGGSGGGWQDLRRRSGGRPGIGRPLPSRLAAAVRQPIRYRRTGAVGRRSKLHGDRRDARTVLVPKHRRNDLDRARRCGAAAGGQPGRAREASGGSGPRGAPGEPVRRAARVRSVAAGRAPRPARQRRGDRRHAGRACDEPPVSGTCWPAASRWPG